MFLRRTIILGAVGVVIGLAAYLIYHHYHHRFAAKTTSTAQTAQNNYSGGTNRPTSNGGASQGGIVDEKGQTTETATGTPTSSSSGNITLNTPSASQLLATGDTLAGTAEVDVVQFRLIDSQSGVIAQGTLQVVNGSFAGKLQFQAYSTTGKLDVFSYDTTGKEINNVSVPVQFKE